MGYDHVSRCFDHAVELTRLVRAITVADQSGVRQRE
jgi:hypothetical protein